ncbi:unnamed protein product [Mytilus coruscus]|uniref:Uncharacterized protein n=1 Tax=Mytilus coruscus TaxID=42192 RepID=A0A6J8A2Z7_MYTCO|nr:unnamed protein product [Mytilus coruscus]
MQARIGDLEKSLTEANSLMGSFQHDHTYQSSASFDEINNLYFSGKLKPIGYTRHVIDIKTFFDNTRCTKCDITLKLKDGIGILPAGLCGHLIVRCFNCHDFVRLAMGKTHNSSHGPRMFDVNTKLATGTLQADNDDSEAIHVIASWSKTATALSRIPSTDNNNSVCEPVNVTGITASTDGAYQRRVSGRCYNSLSGTASLIGKGQERSLATVLDIRDVENVMLQN